MVVLQETKYETVEAVCTELDNLSVRMLEVMKEYMDCKVMIEDYMKTGSLHLAKSRYIMGNKSVSALQLPSEDGNDLTAQTRINHSEDCKDDLPLLELSRLTLEERNDGLKHRRGNKNEKSTPDENNDDTNTDERGRNTDPLKWFGYLVPQNLRHAQNNFNLALEVVVQCANLQIEITKIQNKYKELLTQKRSFNKSDKS